MSGTSNQCREPEWDLKKATQEFQRGFIIDALDHCEWRRTPTATRLGLSREGLYKLMKRLGITKVDSHYDWTREEGSTLPTKKGNR